MNGRNFILSGDFSRRVDWKIANTSKENTISLIWQKKNFLNLWAREMIRCTNFLELVLTTEDDINENISVVEELRTIDHKMVSFTLKVPDLATVSHSIRKLDFEKQTSKPC